MKAKSPSVKSESERFMGLLNDSMRNGFNDQDLQVEYIAGEANGLYFKSSIDKIVVTRRNANTNNETYTVLALVGNDSGIRLGRAIDKYISETPTVRLRLSLYLYNLTPIKYETSFLPEFLSRLDRLYEALKSNKRLKGFNDLLRITSNSKIMCKPVFKSGIHEIEVIANDSKNDVEYRLLFRITKDGLNVVPAETNKIGTYILDDLLANDFVALEKSEQIKFLNRIKLAALYEISNTFNTDLGLNLNMSLANAIGDDYQQMAKYLTLMDNLFEQTQDEETFLKVIELNEEEQNLLSLEHDIIYPEFLNNYQADKKLN
ncbi:hypothetical protein ALP22_02176 [Pseudomonas coronafaciens pv. porri]|uniref:hypothetical protein n=1 Tax=Pseudomonas syringae group TaxID=136849 RepID=UPI000F00ACBB|nr:hypothetical protein [Pseudomonas coronafaciens]RMU89369.1 hypothetical protein ALP22_02176 [Pseudomonas coronafaciens pv. porri]